MAFGEGYTGCGKSNCREKESSLWLTRNMDREIPPQKSQFCIFPAGFGLLNNLSWFCFTCQIEDQWQLPQWKIPRFGRSRRCILGCWFIAGFVLIE